MTTKNKHIGSDFDDFLVEEGILEEVEARAAKKALVIQLNRAMARRKMNKNLLARNLHTSRAAIDRLLDPNYIGLNMKTIFKVAAALRAKVKISVEQTA